MRSKIVQDQMIKLTTIKFDGTRVFRGVLAPGEHHWFTPRFEVAKIYGDVYQFQQNEAIICIDMGDVSNIRALEPLYRAWAKKTGKNANALKHCFLNGRDSEFEADEAVMQFMTFLQLPVDGFGSEWSVDHHAEMYLPTLVKLGQPTLVSSMSSEKRKLLLLSRNKRTQKKRKPKRKVAAVVPAVPEPAVPEPAVKKTLF